MKIKKFNESNLNDGIQLMVDNYLSFLKDNGFHCYINSSRYNTHISIYRRDTQTRFNLSDVADDFIPFLKILNDKYKISDNSVVFTSCTPMRKLSEYNRGFFIDDILGGRIPKDISCNSICIQVDYLK